MAAHRYWRLKLNTSPSGTYLLLAEVKMYLRGSATNIANTGVASASGSSFGEVASKAIDGSTATYWEYMSNGVFPQWWQLDFGAGNAKDIGKIEISSHSRFETEMPTDFEIQWSDDNIAFTTVFRVTNLVWVINKTYGFGVPDTGDLNYYGYRLNISSANGGAFINVAELAMRSVSGGANLALNQTPVDSVKNISYPAAAAFDGSATTAWESNSGTTAAWVGALIPAPATMNEISISIRTDRDANTAPKDFTFEGTRDGVSWMPIKAFTGQTGWSPGETRTFSLAAGAGIATRLQIFVCT